MVVTRDCIEKSRREDLAEANLAKRVWFLKLVSPSLGNRPIPEIQPIDVLQAVRPIEAKGQLESARCTLEFIGQVSASRWPISWSLLIRPALFAER